MTYIIGKLLEVSNQRSSHYTTRKNCRGTQSIMRAPRVVLTYRDFFSVPLTTDVHDLTSGTHFFLSSKNFGELIHSIALLLSRLVFYFLFFKSFQILIHLPQLHSRHASCEKTLPWDRHTLKLTATFSATLLLSDCSSI